MRNITVALLILTTFFSCNGFLNVNPDTRAEVSDAQKVGELLVYAYPERGFQEFTEVMSDNSFARNMLLQNLLVNEQEMTLFFTWADTSSILTQDVGPNLYWLACYKAIAHANTALETLSKFNQNDEQVQIYTGEALLARAYAHFMLVNIFAKAYNPTTASSDPGVPYVTEVETQFLKQYKRQSVAEVYDAIQSDLERGLSLAGSDYKSPKFRFTREAGLAFATRFYLYKGDLDAVIRYANMLLPNDPSTVIRDWVDYKAQGFSITKYAEYLPSSSDRSNLLIINALGSYRTQAQQSGKYGMNSLGNALIGEGYWKDSTLKLSYPVDATGSFIFDSYFIPKFDSFYYEGATLTGNLYTYAAFTYDEVLFNRAEAYALKEEYQKCLDDINVLSSKSYENYVPATHDITVGELEADYQPGIGALNPQAFTIPDKALNYIYYILDFRRKAFYLEGLRWFDIKRYDFEIKHTTTSGDEMVLAQNDLRRQVQIPQQSLAAGLEQNPR